MAYRNLVAQVCTDKADWFTRFRDFLCARDATHNYAASGIGWTLHDSSYAVDEDNPELNDWFVVFSAGESGKETMYYKFTWQTDDIQLLGFSYWDNSAHTGTDQYGISSGSINIDDAGSAYDIYIYGDLDFAYAWETLEDTYDYCFHFGKLEDDVYDTTPAQCSSPITAGSDVSVVLDVIPSGWVAGTTNVLVRYRDTVERAIVKTIVSTTITIDLVNSYSADAVFQEQVSYTANSATGFIFNSYGLYNHASSGDLTTSFAMVASLLVFSTNAFDPDPLYDDFLVSDTYLIDNGLTNAWYGKFPNLVTVPAVMTMKTTHSMGSDTYRAFLQGTTQYVAIREV